MEITRGDIFIADLNPVQGSEQGGIRPVLVIQNDRGNRFSPTVICAAISIPVPHSSASPMVACTSPICRSAPGTRTGKYRRVPLVMSLLSMLPP